MQNVPDLKFRILSSFENFYLLCLYTHFDNTSSYSAKTDFLVIFRKNGKIKRPITHSIFYQSGSNLVCECILMSLSLFVLWVVIKKSNIMDNKWEKLNFVAAILDFWRPF